MQIIAEARNIFGKKLKKAREEGKLPVVLYGPAASFAGRRVKRKESISLFVSSADFNKVWKEAGESTIIELKEEKEGKPVNVLIHDVAVDPVKNEPLHVDFLAVEMDKLITTNVALVFEGTALAVKELGGVLVKVMHEIEVEALPKDLPSELKVDISKLAAFEDKIHIKDIVLPAGVRITLNPDEVVALVEPPREEEAAAAEEAPSLEDIEVEKKGKKEEGEKSEGDGTSSEAPEAGK